MVELFKTSAETFASFALKPGNFNAEDAEVFAEGGFSAIASG